MIKVKTDNTQSDYDAQKDGDEGQNIKNVLCSEKSKEKANDNVTAVSGIRYCRKCGNKLEPGKLFFTTFHLCHKLIV